MMLPLLYVRVRQIKEKSYLEREILKNASLLAYAYNIVNIVKSSNRSDDTAPLKYFFTVGGTANHD